MQTCHRIQTLSNVACEPETNTGTLRLSLFWLVLAHSALQKKCVSTGQALVTGLLVEFFHSAGPTATA